LEIAYKNNKIRKTCADASFAGKKYGQAMAEKLQQRIAEIKAAESVEFMILYHIGRYHPLTGNRTGQYAVDLIHPYRLVFEKTEAAVHIVTILEVVDYY